MGLNHNFTKVSDQIERDHQILKVPDSWVIAFLKGNILFPQKPLGVVNCLCEALFKENVGLESYLEARLSGAQVKRLIDKMNAMHRVYEVAVFTKEYLQSILAGEVDFRVEENIEPKILEDSYLNVSWQAAKISLLQYLCELVRLLDIESREIIPHNFKQYNRGMHLPNVAKNLETRINAKPELSMKLKDFFQIVTDYLKRDELGVMVAYKELLLQFSQNRESQEFIQLCQKQREIVDGITDQILQESCFLSLETQRNEIAAILNDLLF